MSGHHHGQAIMAVIQLTASAAKHHVGQRSADRQARMEAELRRYELDAARETDGFAHELAMAKVRVIQGVVAGRLELAFKSFDFMKGIIEREHASLLDERKTINAAKLAATDDRIMINLGKRLGQINTEMADLRKNGMLLVAQVNHIAQSIGSDYQVPPLMIAAQ